MSDDIHRPTHAGPPETAEGPAPDTAVTSAGSPEPGDPWAPGGEGVPGASPSDANTPEGSGDRGEEDSREGKDDSPASSSLPRADDEPQAAWATAGAEAASEGPRAELLVGGAFAGGLLTAILLRRLGS